MTGKPAAISASLVDVRNIATHKVVRLEIHVPAEQAGLVLAAFGWPTGVDPVPVAIARLDLSKVTSDTPKPASEPKERRRFVELSLAAQAALRCNEKAFWKFLTDEMNYANIDDAELAADAVRDICGVESRAAIRDGEPSGKRWDRLNADYVNWMHPA
jgi:hypothetical protein